MTASADPAPSHGINLIASYRAARLDQRPAFHAGSQAAMARLDRPEMDKAAEPNQTAGAADPPIAQNETAAPLPAIVERPLAESGFGPGMAIRLGQLGLRTTGDLARADVAQLRAALGDISRLVDVEGWIQSARLDCGIAGL